MKRSSPLWGSVSVLIGVVIAILALAKLRVDRAGC